MGSENNMVAVPAHLDKLPVTPSRAQDPAALLAHLRSMPMTEWVWGDAEMILATLAATPPSPALDAATIERCDCIDLEALTYDELWQAIADATRVEAGIVAISVVKFREAIRALPNAEKRQNNDNTGEVR